MPEPFEGRSLWPLVAEAGEGRSTADRESYAGWGLPLFPDASVQHAINTGSWTLARSVAPDPNPVELLNDRRVDPDENVNLIEREPRDAARMRAVLRRATLGPAVHDSQPQECLSFAGWELWPGRRELCRWII